MREGAKRRLVGAIVIVAMAVIFVPMIFEDDSIAPPDGPISVPDEPELAAAPNAGAALPVPDEALGSDGPLSGESEPLPLPSPEPAEDAPSAGSQGRPGELGRFAGAETAAEPEPLDPEAQGAEVEDAPAAARAKPTSARASRQQTQAQAQEPVEPSPPPPPRDGAPSWVVQVASLGSSEAAGQLASKLKGAGFAAFVEKAEVKGKLFYRVRVGPAADRDGAERAAAALRQRQKLDTLIQRYP